LGGHSAGPNIVGADLPVGLLFVIAAGGFGELAIMMAGWGSNNKYALLGGFRAVALLVSYEMPDGHFAADPGHAGRLDEPDV
jgi:NADH:ubiquinone oxidoreductase subunit H